MDITSALSRVEAVVNQYHAFIEIKEALEAAVQAQRVEVECGLRAKALQEEIEGLELGAELLAAQIGRDGKLAKAREADEHIAFEALKGEVDSLLAAKYAELDKLAAKVAEAEESYRGLIVTHEETVKKLREQADAEEARFAAAKRTMADLKAAL
jgi:hypothetical protein